MDGRTTKRENASLGDSSKSAPPTEPNGANGNGQRPGSSVVHAQHDSMNGANGANGDGRHDHAATHATQATQEAPWRSKCPKEVRSAWRSDPQSAGWKLWVAHLSDQDCRAGYIEDLAWGLPDQEHPTAVWLGRLTAMLRRPAGSRPGRGKKARRPKHAKDKLIAAAVETWCLEAPHRPASVAFGLESIAWARLLPRLAGPLGDQAWWDLLGELRSAAEAAASGPPVPPDSPAAFLAQQLLGGELALTLAASVLEIEACWSLRKSAHTCLSEGILAVCDGEGLPSAVTLDVLPMLAPCWTRVRSLRETIGKPVWSSDAQIQYEWLVRQLLRLVRPDGTLLLAGPHEDLRPFLAVALELDGDASDKTAASQRLGFKVGRTGLAIPPEPAVESEWSAVSVLSGGWNDNSPQIGVAYDGRQLRLDVGVGKRRLLVGDWPVLVEVDGRPATLASDWEQQCWYSDNECDYLEIAANLTEGGRLERQIFLARHERVGYLAEVLIDREANAAPRKIESRWTLSTGIEFRGEAETREGFLTRRGKPLAGVMPLALPEWRTDTSRGELALFPEGALSQVVQGVCRNLHAIVWFDFDPKRFARQRTWRQLTVAHKLERVERDAAVGYRVQSGIEQWMLYRSLDPPQNRTVLGQNTVAEATVGRFLPTGVLKEYFEVTGDG